MSTKEKITNLFHVLQYNNCDDDSNNNRKKQQRKTRLYCHLGVSDDKTGLLVLSKFSHTVKHIIFFHMKNKYLNFSVLEVGSTV